MVKDYGLDGMEAFVGSDPNNISISTLMHWWLVSGPVLFPTFFSFLSLPALQLGSPTLK